MKKKSLNKLVTINYSTFVSLFGPLFSSPRLILKKIKIFNYIHFKILGSGNDKVFPGIN